MERELTIRTTQKVRCCDRCERPARKDKPVVVCQLIVGPAPAHKGELCPACLAIVSGAWARTPRPRKAVTDAT